MRKIAIKQFAVTLCVACFLLVKNDAAAQCSYKVITLRGDTTSYAIPSDFPIKPNTGDLAADQTNFLAAFVAWNKNNSAIKDSVLPTITTTGIKNVFFEIPVSAVPLFSDEKKTAMRAHPQLYVLKP